MKSIASIPSLTLMSNRQNQNSILLNFKTIKRDIPSFAARDNQFPQVRFDWTPDQWMTLQYRDSFFDQFNGFRSG